MAGHIECYLDLASFYSYMGVTYLLKNRDLLKSHEVAVDFIPIFLGGVNHGSGNKPPWSLRAKATYGRFDMERTKKYHGLEKVEAPDFFPPVTLLPMRALCYIKAKFPQEIFENAWLELFQKLWTPPQVNVTLPDVLAQVLRDSKLFSDSEVEGIMKAAGEKEWKDKLLANTKTVLDKGAFGAPWMWVRNAEGKEEPFFGSDRFHFIWDFLGFLWKDIEIVPKGGEKPKL